MEECTYLWGVNTSWGINTTESKRPLNQEDNQAPQPTQMALKICGLYNFWALKGMRAQVRLLQFLMDYWDPDSENFNLDGKPLRIEFEDIYFLTRLSRRGEVVNLKARGDGSGMKIEEYIDAHCIAGTDKVGSQLPIQAINNLSLKIVFLVLTWITGSASLH
jgi:hypothetical protein